MLCLSGKILTIETVSLKLPRRHWEGPEVDPDKTYFADEYLRHVLYITRIYFIYGPPEDELIGKLRNNLLNDNYILAKRLVDEYLCYVYT